MRGESAVVVHQRVGDARITVTDDEPVDPGRSPRRARASTAFSCRYSGDRSAGPCPSAIRSSARTSRVSTLHSNGHRSTGRRSCSRRNPAPIAAAAVTGSATHRGSTAERPATCAVTGHAPASSAPYSSTRGTVTHRRAPGQPLRLAAQIDLRCPRGNPLGIPDHFAFETKRQAPELITPHRDDRVDTGKRLDHLGHVHGTGRNLSGNRTAHRMIVPVDPLR
jgi:hypothetical protein